MGRRRALLDLSDAVLEVSWALLGPVLARLGGLLGALGGRQAPGRGWGPRKGSTLDLVFGHVFCLEGRKRRDFVTKMKASWARCVGGPNYCFARSERARHTPTAASAVADIYIYIYIYIKAAIWAQTAPRRGKDISAEENCIYIYIYIYISKLPKAKQLRNGDII